LKPFFIKDKKQQKQKPKPNLKKNVSATHVDVSVQGPCKN
jgi:hypothetical protein